VHDRRREEGPAAVNQCSSFSPCRHSKADSQLKSARPSPSLPASPVPTLQGLGVHIGRPQPQSKDGKLINHVKMHYPQASKAAAEGGAPAPVPQREHAQNLEFGVHTDAQADCLGECGTGVLGWGGGSARACWPSCGRACWLPTGTAAG
jgi:hypothetical protein